MKIIMTFFAFTFLMISSAMASGEVILTCAGRNDSTQGYTLIEWRQSELNSTPKRRYLAFPNGSPLLLAASRVNNETIVTIKGSLFEFDRTAQKNLVVDFGTDSTATARDSNGHFERVTCFLQ